MERKILNSSIKNLHFVGVGGVSTSALATYALNRNFNVSGSDVAKNTYVDALVKKGAKITLYHDKSNVEGADALVVTSAVGEDNPEVSTARLKGIPVFERAELLGEIVGGYKNSVAVSGSHGKTTATAMLSSVLIKAGLDPTVFLGGEYSDFGNFRDGKSEYLVLEACEYKRNMLYIKPRIAVVLNVDDDHLDTYGTLNNEISAFREFASGRIAVINADDENSKTLFNSSTVTFGIDNLATYSAKNLKYNGSGYTFTACAYSRRLERINLKVMGIHNVYNALATIAVADVLGINIKTVKTALESFRGVKRRSECLGAIKGVTCYADYAHHPSEIKATISAFKESGVNPLVVFQPHTYSRTKMLMKDFILSLKDERGLIVYKTYPAREKYDILGDAKTLCENLNSNGANCIYADNEESLFDSIDKNLNGKDAVLVLGAGNIYDVFANNIKLKEKGDR